MLDPLLQGPVNRMGEAGTPTQHADAPRWMSALPELCIKSMPLLLVSLMIDAPLTFQDAAVCSACASSKRVRGRTLLRHGHRLVLLIQLLQAAASLLVPIVPCTTASFAWS